MSRSDIPRAEGERGAPADDDAERASDSILGPVEPYMGGAVVGADAFVVGTLYKVLGPT